MFIVKCKNKVKMNECYINEYDYYKIECLCMLCMYIKLI